MSEIAGMKKPDLIALPQISDRMTFLYLEHCHLNRDDGAITITDASIQHFIRNRQKYGVQNRNKAPDRFVILDLETTGLDEREDKIIEVGLLHVEKGEVIKEYSCLVKTDHPVPDQIAALTGITSELLEKEGKPIQSVISEAMTYIGTGPVVCHNPGFDLSFLRVACQKHEVPMPSIKAIDTCSMAREKNKSS